MIPVTKPFLPSKLEYDKLIQQVWNRNWLTNNGPLLNKLELKLKTELDLPYFILVLNGTLALQMAFKTMKLKGKFITTPFSYVATVSSGVWENLEPVFVDIDPNTFNIDPVKLEDAITPDVSCIVATHTFGNPCDLESIQMIAKKYDLRVIYDASHAFGVKYKGRGLLSYGDVSTLSLHATKLYHMIEGGGIATNDPELLRLFALSRNFGHQGVEFEGVGINAKNSEFHAAMGLANFPYIPEIMSRRKEQAQAYDVLFEESDFSIVKQRITDGTDYNYSYYPMIMESDIAVEKTINELNAHNIYPRRYFYPSLDSLPYVESKKMPVSQDISSRIICLPLYHDLTLEDQEYIVRIFIRSVKY